MTGWKSVSSIFPRGRRLWAAWSLLTLLAILLSLATGERTANWLFDAWQRARNSTQDPAPQNVLTALNTQRNHLKDVLAKVNAVPKTSGRGAKEARATATAALTAWIEAIAFQQHAIADAKQSDRDRAARLADSRFARAETQLTAMRKALYVRAN